LLVAAVMLLWPLTEGSRLLLVVPALSPLVALASLVATRTFQIATLIGLAVAGIVLIRRRWFCRWVCPTGTCADLAAMPGLRLGRRCPRCPNFGRWIALLTLGGAVLGYPLLLWLDPVAMFSALPGLRHVRTVSGTGWCGVGLLAVLVLSVAWPGLWCTRLCPLGAFQEMLFELGRRVRSVAARPPESVQEEATGWPRRIVLGAALGLSWAAVTRRVRGSVSPPLRPPGAVDEARFAGVCVRCGNCLRACPTQIIRPDQGEHGIAGLLTPTVDFSNDYCREDCTRCTEVCPSGALAPVAPREKQHASIGLPRVNMDICLLGEDGECSACRNWCPYGAVTYVFSESEYALTPRIDPDRCPGCGACEVACPTAPTKAITIHAC